MPRTRIFTRSKPPLLLPSSCNQDTIGQTYPRSPRKNAGKTSNRSHHGKYRPNTVQEYHSAETENPPQGKGDVDFFYPPPRTTKKAPVVFTQQKESPLTLTIVQPSNSDYTDAANARQITFDVWSGHNVHIECRYHDEADKDNNDTVVIGRENSHCPSYELKPAPLTSNSIDGNKIDILLPHSECVGIQSMDASVNDDTPMYRKGMDKNEDRPGQEERALESNPPEILQENTYRIADTPTKKRRKPRKRSKRTRPTGESENYVVISNSLKNYLDADSGVEVCSQSSALSSKVEESLHCHQGSGNSRSSSDDRQTSCSDSSPTIPFYFKEPDIGPEISFNGDQLPWNLEDRDDDDSVVSWSEFDISQNDLGSDISCVQGEDISPCLDVFSELTVGDIISSKNGEESGCIRNTDFDESNASLADTSISDSYSTETETDYDSSLPSHVLMHVKRDIVSVLMEYGQTREVKVSFTEIVRSGPHHASRFHTSAIVDGKMFPEGCGSSKKYAKKAAASYALQVMYEQGKRNLQVVNVEAHRKLLGMTDEEVGSHAHRVVLVSRHVLDTCEETQFINFSKDKIAATFVLEYNGKMKVVGLGTGNRCILYQNMTLDGQRVIHAHAEIIARRAFLRFLYKQLLSYEGKSSHPILTRSDTGKLKLRDKIQVHLYISRPPCGDAAAFPTISNFPNRLRAIRKQGQLRTIIDDGEGAIPTDFTVSAGVNGKERLRIMTCSDKICRWNVLGVQGALLSHFVDPIYLSSLVIGSHTGDQRGHVPRAVSGRLKCGRLHEVIQRPYRLNSPEIHYPHDDLSDTYNITKSKQYCITWTLGDEDAEVIDAITGLVNMEPLETVMKSRVSKMSLMELFQQVCHKYGCEDLTRGSYAMAKKYATTFQRMKSFVGQHLVAMGFGQWYSLQETYGTDDFACPGSC